MKVCLTTIKWYIYKYCMDHMSSMLKGCLTNMLNVFEMIK